MKRLKFFGIRNHEVKNLMKVFQIPKEIVFEKEEEAAISKELEQNKDILKEKVNSKDVIEMMESGFAASGLAGLAEIKLETGNLQSAFYCCIKSLALFDSYELNWVLLAKLLAMHGALSASQKCLDYAQKVHEANGKVQPELLEKDYEENWLYRKNQVIDIIDKGK